MNGSAPPQGNIRTLGERGSPLSRIIVVVVVAAVVVVVVVVPHGFEAQHLQEQSHQAKTKGQTTYSGGGGGGLRAR